MKLRRRTYRSGRVGWQLDYGIVNGRRKQVALKKVTTERQAEKALKEAQDAVLEHGRSARGLTAEDVAELTVARERLNGVPIMTAVEFYMANARVVRSPITVGTMIEPYLNSKPPENLGATWRSKVEGLLEGFARSVEPSLVHEVTTTQVETWLNGNGWMGRTRNNYLTEVRSFFAWGMKKERGHCAANPTDGIKRVRIGDEEIQSLTVEESAALLKAAWEAPDQRLLGFVVLGIFCGIRPEELVKTKWSMVNLEERTVVVMGKIAKTRRRRPVDISKNAVAWLKDWKPTHEPLITPKAFPWHWPRLRAEAGWTKSGRPGKKPWPHDAMRHTYASMHYAQHQNERLLQAQMGHEDDEMLHRHYRAMRTRAEAAKFWALMPP